ncbi:hypothetical protein F444_09009 [Phytophthora nicotianae P1976]|uniref:Uncharacterized protein n=1 Tax=Phytophthora nicotianae P1976 TaxID=1317066 RepID=A0A081A906_PHYNI|nr:hypothetical protein F444_09009 [Phytophthora nicotianae P1976]
MPTGWIPVSHPRSQLKTWLAIYGGIKPKPINGQPIKTVNVASVDFDLYFGFDLNMGLFAYVAKQFVVSIKGNLKLFFKELPFDNRINDE